MFEPETRRDNRRLEPRRAANKKAARGFLRRKALHHALVWYDTTKRGVRTTTELHADRWAGRPRIVQDALHWCGPWRSGAFAGNPRQQLAGHIRPRTRRPYCNPNCNEVMRIKPSVTFTFPLRQRAPRLQATTRDAEDDLSGPRGDRAPAAGGRVGMVGSDQPARGCGGKGTDCTFGSVVAWWSAMVCALFSGANVRGQGSGAGRERSAVDQAAGAGLEEYLATLTKDGKCPAIWAGKFWANDGRSVQACSGVRKWGQPAAVRLNDRLHLGSCTKAMTAVLVAQTIARGKLSWQSTLADIFAGHPSLPGSDWGPVRVIDLLHHESGLPANAPWDALDQAHPNDPMAARRAMLDWIVQQTRAPSPAFVYSNAGYALLGHIVETVEQEPWERLIARRLFEPLGIQSAGFGPVSGVDELDHPWGHHVSEPSGGVIGRALNMLVGRQPDWVPVEVDNPPPLGPAGRVHMTLQDWARFVQLFAKTDAPHQELGLTEATWRTLVQTEGDGNYAGGWIVTQREWAGGEALTHTGSNTTWFCVAWVAPRRGFSVLVAANGFAPSTPAICDQVAARLVWGEFDPASK
ncbi:MAG: class A beta-lactamase-related serine hydrolase [Planctomycetota bacterium]|nr:MAG: class A beta-lactamase-related serine hydrolase [Planctomycetota bacterium]